MELNTELMMREREDLEPIERYSQIVPLLLSDSLMGFRNKKLKAIITILEMNDELSFSEIKETLQLRSNDLSNQLNILEELGLIKNEIEKKEGVSQFSWYLLTEFGRNLLKKLLEAYIEYINPERSLIDIEIDEPSGMVTFHFDKDEGEFSSIDIPPKKVLDDGSSSEALGYTPIFSYLSINPKLKRKILSNVMEG